MGKESLGLRQKILITVFAMAEAAAAAGCAAAPPTEITRPPVVTPIGGLGKPKEPTSVAPTRELPPNMAFSRRLQDLLGIHPGMSRDALRKQVVERVYHLTWVPKLVIGDYILPSGKQVSFALSPSGQQDVSILDKSSVRPPEYKTVDPVKEVVIAQKGQSKILVRGSVITFQVFSSGNEAWGEFLTEFTSAVDHPVEIYFVFVPHKNSDYLIGKHTYADGTTEDIKLEGNGVVAKTQTFYKTKNPSNPRTDIAKTVIMINVPEVDRVASSNGTTPLDEMTNTIANELTSMIANDASTEIRSKPYGAEAASTCLGLAAQLDTEFANFILGPSHTKAFKKLIDEMRRLTSRSMAPQQDNLSPLTRSDYQRLSAVYGRIVRAGVSANATKRNRPSGINIRDLAVAV